MDGMEIVNSLEAERVSLCLQTWHKILKSGSNLHSSGNKGFPCPKLSSWIFTS